MVLEHQLLSWNANSYEYMFKDKHKLAISYQISTTTNHYREHSVIVQHNTKFATVHSQVIVGSCSVEYDYKLLHKFAHIVAHRMPYTSNLSFFPTLPQGHTKRFLIFFQFAIVCLRSYWIHILQVSSNLSATATLFCC